MEKGDKVICGESFGKVVNILVNNDVIIHWVNGPFMGVSIQYTRDSLIFSQIKLDYQYMREEKLNKLGI